MKPLFVMSNYAGEAEFNKARASYYEQLAKTFAANAVNVYLSDAEFRQFVCNCLSEFEAKPAGAVSSKLATPADWTRGLAGCRGGLVDVSDYSNDLAAVQANGWRVLSRAAGGYGRGG